MKLPIIINGPPSAGKDTFIVTLNSLTNIPVYNISSVDKVKEAAKLLHWDGSKDSKSREFLVNLKALAREFNNHPVIYMLESWEEIDEGIVFFHIREPDEIKSMKKHLGALTVLINNRRAEKHLNLSDLNTHMYDYDIIINNNGTLKELKLEASKFLEYVTKINT